MKEKFEIDVEWLYFPLHPATPPSGQLLEEMFRGKGVDIETMDRRMKSLMEIEGLPYVSRTHTYNSRLAQELGKWADTQPGGMAIHDALYRAYFANGLNIANIEVLIEVAKSVGLSPQIAQKVLEERLFKGRVDADWARSAENKISAVPTFMFQGKTLVGAQPYDSIELFLRQSDVELRKLN